MTVKAKKHLGQHFLRDENIAQKEQAIIKADAVKPKAKKSKAKKKAKKVKEELSDLPF